MFELSGGAWLQAITNGICLAGIYILIGLGLTLIMSIMRIVQFAHGEVYMIGAFVVYFLTVMNGVNMLVAILAGMIVTGILGLLLERFLLRPLGGEFLPAICVTFGLSLILQTIIVLAFGLSVKSVPNVWPGVFHFFGAVVPRDRLTAVLISLCLTSVLYFILKRTKYGLAVVASAQNREGAVIQGINPNVMAAMVMMIGCALAAVGGALGGGIFTLDPYMGGSALMKGLNIIIIGGMGSFLGAVMGGLILGLSESLVSLALGTWIAQMVPLIIIIIILVIRPKGLFGYE